MKRIFAMLLAMLLCVPFIGLQANAAEAGVSLSSASGLPGEEITVNVTISGNPGIAYLKLFVGYDSSALTLVSASNAGLLGGIYTTSQTVDVNPYVLQWMAAGNSVGDGLIATLTFRINDTAKAGQQNITLALAECYNQDLDDVELGMSGCIVTVTKPVCNHVWDAGKVTTPAGCETKGVKTYTCTVTGCGETKTEDIPATGHTFGDWTVTKKPTCTEKGEETRKCACGKTETRDVAATGHTFGDWTVTKKPTCTEKGEETRKCACGETEKRDVAATGHTFGDWTVTKEATCTEKGEETRKCACGETEKRDVAATGHTFGDWTVTKEATCTEKGEETRKCACGETEKRDVAATGHTFGDWTVTKEATCTEKGEETRECACGETETREIAVKDHAVNSYGKDDTSHWALCDNCDYVGEKEAHSYDYNGVCVCGATKTVEKDPDLDDVPKTGDITPNLAAVCGVLLIAMAGSVLLVVKRRTVK